MAPRDQYLFCISFNYTQKLPPKIRGWLQDFELKNPELCKFLHTIQSFESPDLIADVDPKYNILTKEEWWKFSRCGLFLDWCSGYTKTIKVIRQIIRKEKESKESKEKEINKLTLQKFEYFFKKIKYKKGDNELFFAFLYNYKTKEEITDTDLFKLKVHPSRFDYIRDILWEFKNTSIFKENMEKIILKD
jgi:hypothetical protein